MTFTFTTNSFFKHFSFTGLLTFITRYLCQAALHFHSERQVIYLAIICAQPIFHWTSKMAPVYGCWDILTQLLSCSNSVKRLYHNEIISLMSFQVKSIAVVVKVHFNLTLPQLSSTHPYGKYDAEIKRSHFPFFALAWLTWLIRQKLYSVFSLHIYWLKDWAQVYNSTGSSDFQLQCHRHKISPNAVHHTSIKSISLIMFPISEWFVGNRCFVEELFCFHSSDLQVEYCNMVSIQWCYEEKYEN